MDESDHTTKPAQEPPTPEVAQLLKMIEFQTQAQRDRLAALPRAYRGSSFRYGSLIGIVIFAIGSIVAMEYVVSQLPKPGQRMAIPGPPIGLPAAKTANPAADPGPKGQSGS
ncbi:MAG: hypothetical protein ABSE62_09385 [Chthoniobacteraceae bacterium]|jgi:hypothetical protein